MLDRITHAFSDCIEILMLSADQLSSVMLEAAAMISNILINEGKIITGGVGVSSSDAQDFAAQLTHKYCLERPALPIIALSSNLSIITDMSQSECFDHLFSKQIKALGTSRDVLFLINSHAAVSSLVEAIQAAHLREMKVVLLHGESENAIQLSSLLYAEDLELKVPSTHSARIQEVHRLVLNNLCQLIDEHLFGLQD